MLTLVMPARCLGYLLVGEVIAGRRSEPASCLFYRRWNLFWNMGLVPQMMERFNAQTYAQLSSYDCSFRFPDRRLFAVH